MKNKKGYTLIEIIIAIVLIILIGTISIISIKKPKEELDEEKKEFIKKLELDATVYYENNKHTKKFKEMEFKNDWQIIRIRELISEGLLDENSYKSIMNGNIDDCIKVQINEDMNIDIKYTKSGEDELCVPFERKPIYIHITNDNEETNKVKLNNSLYETYGKELRNNISNGEYIKEKFEDPGAVLKDEDGNVFGNLKGEFEFRDGKAIYTYTVTEDFKYYDKVEKKSAIRTVTYDDKREPIIITLNNGKENEILLDNSYDMFINNGKDLNKKISNGEYIKENFKDPGAVLKGKDTKEIYGNLVGIYSFDKETKKAKYTYTVTEDFLYYDLVNDKTVSRTVKYKDESGPIIIHNSSNYAYSENDYIYTTIYTYNGYMDFWSMYINLSDEYYIFDNLDGIKSFDLDDYYYYYNFDSFNWAANNIMYDTFEIQDKNGNNTKYNLEVYAYYNEPPYIWYDENYSYFYDYEIYNSNNEIYPIYNYIYVEDWDSSYYSYYYYLIDDNGNYFYPSDTNYLNPGNYTLYIEAYDEFDYSSAYYNIYIYYYYYEPYYDEPCDDHYNDDHYNDDYCGDACIIEKMIQNSEDWRDASPEQQEWLHQENERLAGELSGNTYYTEDGYWHNDDGSYLYGDSYYNDYYGYGDY